MTTKAPLAEGIFTWPSDDPRLLGSRCANCGNHVFPVQDGCAKCMSDVNETVELANRGTLWTWTVQGFPPKSPPYKGPIGDDFKPYGVGYIELPGQLRVESRLTEADPEKLKIGMDMELVIETIGPDDEGNEFITFAFAPIDDS